MSDKPQNLPSGVRLYLNKGKVLSYPSDFIKPLMSAEYCVSGSFSSLAHYPFCFCLLPSAAIYKLQDPAQEDSLVISLSHL